LHGGDADIKRNAVDPGEARRGNMLVEFGKQPARRMSRGA
jgi:hypothetical protein